jgi:hypothetical protein
LEVGLSRILPRVVHGKMGVFQGFSTGYPLKIRGVMGFGARETGFGMGSGVVIVKGKAVAIPELW